MKKQLNCCISLFIVFALILSFSIPVIAEEDPIMTIFEQPVLYEEDFEVIAYDDLTMSAGFFITFLISAPELFEFAGLDGFDDFEVSEILDSVIPSLESLAELFEAHPESLERFSDITIPIAAIDMSGLRTFCAAIFDELKKLADEYPDYADSINLFADSFFGIFIQACDTIDLLINGPKDPAEKARWDALADFFLTNEDFQNTFWAIIDTDIDTDIDTSAFTDEFSNMFDAIFMPVSDVFSKMLAFCTNVAEKDNNPEELLAYMKDIETFLNILAENNFSDLPLIALFASTDILDELLADISSLFLGLGIGDYPYYPDLNEELQLIYQQFEADINEASFLGLLDGLTFAFLSEAVKSDGFTNLLFSFSAKLADVKTGKISELDYKSYANVSKSLSTKGDVLNAFFDVLKSYHFADLKTFNKSAVEYFTETGIITEDFFADLDEPCTLAESVVAATRIIKDTFNRINYSSKGVFFKAQKDDTIVYILGNLATPSNKNYPLSDKILDAYNSADSLYVDIDPRDTDDAYDKILNSALLGYGDTLKDYISPDVYESLEKVLPFFDLNVFKPWFALSLLESEYLYEYLPNCTDVNLRASEYFISKAQIDNKPVDELEGALKHVDIIDTIPDQLVENLLRQQLALFDDKAAAKDIENVVYLQKLWNLGMTDSIAFEVRKTQGLSQFIAPHSKVISDKITEILNSGEETTCFAVVDIANLLSYGGVADTLAKNGFKIIDCNK